MFSFYFLLYDDDDDDFVYIITKAAAAGFDIERPDGVEKEGQMEKRKRIAWHCVFVCDCVLYQREKEIYIVHTLYIILVYVLVFVISTESMNQLMRKSRKLFQTNIIGK